MSAELVEVVRSGFRECVHRGSLVILDRDGEPDVTLGEVHLPIFPRSTNKPMQAITMLRNGFEPIDDAELAIATASHFGEPDHIALVQRLLDRFGLTEKQLECPPDLPSEEQARAQALAGHERAQRANSGYSRAEAARRIYMNCSGKHAAMLATCLINDWPTTGYLDSAHPLQQAVCATIADITGEPETDLGIDGCGLPIVPVSLVNLARAYAAMATGTPGTPQRRVADAIRANPRVISGTDGPDLLTMTATPGLVCKIGADGVHAGALPDGRAFAYKIDDGHDRARMPLTQAILRRMGVEWTEAHADLGTPAVLGGGARVGIIRAIPGLLG
ncbi:asparaginase [Nocardia alni]|uniref:asparaginase n=1 Tax=Nocardia alni TaxID=2815723 RepID=UPI001C248174|nr:asparaginase [Nocardia alni]